MTKTTTASQDEMKQQVAKAAVKYVSQGMTLGIGSGSTVALFIHYLSLDTSLCKSISAVSTSLDTSLLLAKHHIAEKNLHAISGELDLVIDGADEVSSDFYLTKGGGAALLKEKVVASLAKRFIVIVDSSKLVEKLGVFPTPVETVPFAINQVINSIKKLVPGCKKITPRKAKGKLGPLLTDNGNTVLDCSFGCIDDPVTLEKDLNSIPGVVENGIFTRRPELVLVAQPGGSRELTREDRD